MSKLSQLQLTSNAARKATFGLTLALAVATTIAVAHAEKRTFNCNFANRHSQSESVYRAFICAANCRIGASVQSVITPTSALKMNASQIQRLSVW